MEAKKIDAKQRVEKRWPTFELKVEIARALGIKYPYRGMVTRYSPFLIPHR